MLTNKICLVALGEKKTIFTKAHKSLEFLFWWSIFEYYIEYLKFLEYIIFC